MTTTSRRGAWVLHPLRRVLVWVVAPEPPAPRKRKHIPARRRLKKASGPGWLDPNLPPDILSARSRLAACLSDVEDKRDPNRRKAA